MGYKINQEIEFDYEEPPKIELNQFSVGSIVTLDKDGVLLAKGEVLESNEYKYKIKILTTHGHKQRGR